MARLFLSASCFLLAGAAAWPRHPAHGQEQEPSPSGSLNLPTPRAAGDGRPVIGAYYYPWYGVSGRPVERDWRNLLRQKLVPPQTPHAGLYHSDDPAVIAEHLSQSRRAGLGFWAVSWWGPDTATDRTFREAILKHPGAAQLRYAVLYESTGRLGGFRRPRYDALDDDFAYLQEHYFGDPNYLRIDGRPVLFIYLTREYFRNRGHGELVAARKNAPNVYVVGDDVFGPDYQADWACPLDAVTIYDVYGQSAALANSTQQAVDRLSGSYAHARAAANSVGAAFIPTVAPGYNDRAVREGHAGAPRYFVDEPQSQEGDLFRAMIRRAGLPNLDARSGRMMMVTSFNEWYEDTQIEATAGTEGTSSQDNSASGREYAQGDRYADYGTLYLDILREESSNRGNREP
jgi:hypothetical protein